MEGLSVAAVGVDELVSAGSLGDLLEVFGTMEVTFGVAGDAFAGRRVVQGPVCGGGGDADGNSMRVGAVTAVDPQKVVPAALVNPFAVFEPDDGDGKQVAGAVVEEDAFGDAALVAPQVMAASAGT